MCVATIYFKHLGSSPTLPIHCSDFAHTLRGLFVFTKPFNASALIWIKARIGPLPILVAGSGPDAANQQIRTGWNMSAAGDDTRGRPRRKRMEIFAFLFLTAVLMPALAVAVVGSYGLAVWISQIVMGPPGPPDR